MKSTSLKWFMFVLGLQTFRHQFPFSASWRTSFRQRSFQRTKQAANWIVFENKLNTWHQKATDPASNKARCESHRCPGDTYNWATTNHLAYVPGYRSESKEQATNHPICFRFNSYSRWQAKNLRRETLSSDRLTLILTRRYARSLLARKKMK